MPSFQRMFLQKVIYDLKELITRLENETESYDRETYFSDFLKNEITKMTFWGLTKRERQFFNLN